MADDGIFNEVETEQYGQFGDVVVKEKPTNFTQAMDMKVSLMKRSLNAWKDVLLPINSLLNWEKHWHPLSLVGGSTMFFMLVWLLDPSILTTISTIGLIITLSDYLIPQISTSLFKTDTWSDKDEERYDRICRSIVMTQDKVYLFGRSFYLMRSTRPKMYYGISIASLVILAWIGNTINNLLLTYIIVTFILLMPGMESHGILQKYGCVITDKIADMATNAKLNVGDLKKDK